MQTKHANKNPIRCINIRIPTVGQTLQIAEMYRAEGWWQAQDDDRDYLIPRIVEGSHCFMIAVDGDVIVGMGRAISDGISDAYIQDLTVRKDRRHQGIGRIILHALLECLRADGISWIGLIAEPGSFDLYLHAGFRQMKDAVPMLMNGKQ